MVYGFYCLLFILHRHAYDNVDCELKATTVAPDATGFRAHALQARAQLDKQFFKPAHRKFDPKHLPFSVAKPKHIMPRLSKHAYDLNPVVKLKASPVALNGMNGWHVGMGSSDVAPAGVPANPNDPSYLAPTNDVQITPAIQALAKQLDNNPAQIYNWVHNRIEYLPTYGSIQGSDMTLQTLRVIPQHRHHWTENSKANRQTIEVNVKRGRRDPASACATEARWKLTGPRPTSTSRSPQ